MAVSFRPRRGVFHDWAIKNPILGVGEQGFEIDTQRYKMGDGIRRWNDLPYFVNEGATLDFIVESITTVVEPVVAEKVDAVLSTLDVATTQDIAAHVDSLTPHPVYDDGPSLLLLYENAKV
jgi:hypothetical protein